MQQPHYRHHLMARRHGQARRNAGRAGSRLLCAAAAAAVLGAGDAGAAWRETAFLTASDGAANDHMGVLAVDGDTLVVGVGAADGKGAVYVFEKPVDGWKGDLVQVAKLTASDGLAGHGLGASVAVDGDTIVAGAPGEDTEGTDAGAAYVFVRPPGGWADATQTAKIYSTALGATDRFGNSVAVENDTIVVGAPGDQTAFLFFEPMGGWADTTAHSASLRTSEIVNGNQFGSTVAIEDPVIVVGAGSRDSGAGTIYVFERSGPVWVTTTTHDASLVASDRIAGDLLGFNALAYEGGMVAAGIRTRTVNGFGNAGRVYLWTMPGGGWSGTAVTETATIIAPDVGSGDNFGSDVDIEGDVIVVGAGAADVIGAGYRFVEPGTGWTGEVSDGQRLNPASSAGVASFGNQVAASTDAAFVASTNGNVGANADQGFVLAFTDVPCPLAPRQDCTTGESGKGKLQLAVRDGAPEKSLMSWKWSKGDDVDAAELGDPLTDTEYTLCIYDGSSEEVATITIPAGGQCDGKPCWKQTGKGAAIGFKYKDKAGAAGGVTGFGIKAGAAGKPKIGLKARGVNLTVPELPLSQSPDPAVVQLFNSASDACWSAEFSDPADKPGTEKWGDTSD